SPRNEPAEPLSPGLATRIAAARRQIGLTQKDLAVRLGVTLATVARWEAATADPADRLTDIAAITGKSVPWLLGTQRDGVGAGASRAAAPVGAEPVSGAQEVE